MTGIVMVVVGDDEDCDYSGGDDSDGSSYDDGSNEYQACRSKFVLRI